MKIATFALAAMLSAAMPAFAQDAGLPASLAKMDADKDGKLTAAEWAANSATAFAKLDADSNGSYDRAEIVVRYPKETGDVLEARIAKMLKADSNADGKISADEAGIASQASFKKRDKNGDGAITADEAN